MMEAQRWSELCTLFEELVDLDADSRAHRLQLIGASDPELQKNLEDLLAADAKADSRLAGLDHALGSGTGDSPESVDPLKLVGRSVARYRIIEPLARGGMGVVYRAVDPQLDRNVALKFPLPAQRLEAGAKERFLHEARTAGSLDHPNLCSVHDTGETEDGELFLAMPLYEGETLKARLARAGHLAIRDALAIAQQITRGLAAAHGAGIVHRDLKPANVMLLPDGTVKILDFGLAKIEDVSLTISRARIGTVSYMAPEQIRGDPVDARADIWSLGVLLFEMLTGKRPFGGERDVSIAHAIVHERPVLPSTLRRELSPGVEDLIIALLQKDAAKRPATITDVASEIDALLLGQSLPLRLRASRRIRAGYRRLRSRSRQFAVSTVAMLALIVAGGGWLASGLVRADARADDLEHSVAVLPFTSPPDQAGLEYLTVGLLDGLIGQLRGIGDLRVTSRQSALAYRATTKPIAQIARELNVSTVLQGSVQRMGERVRVTARLLNARTNQPLWSNEFERSAADILSIQEEVARGVARTLGAQVTRAEDAQLRRRPSSNARAYDIYLRAHEYELRIPTPEGQKAAETLYTQALQLDSTFALARARKATVGIDIFLNGFDTDPGRMERSRQDAEAALQIQPALVEPHIALGWYWWARREPERSLQQFQTAVRRDPNNAEAHAALGTAYRALGRDTESVAALQRALALDPGDLRTAWSLAGAHRNARRYAEAIRYENYVIERAPDGYMHMLGKGMAYAYWKGTTDTLAAMIERVPLSWNHAGQQTKARLLLARLQRRPIEAVRALTQAQDDEISQYRPAAILKAQAFEAAGDLGRARALFTQARATWSDSVKAHPDDTQMLAMLASTHAGLGEVNAAERLAKQAVQLALRRQQNNPDRSTLALAAEVFARTRNAEAAVETLDMLMKLPAGNYVSPALLRVDPQWDPIRATPAFQRLLARYAGG